MENRKKVHVWLKHHPECIKFVETLTSHLDEETREEVFHHLARYWIWGGYPKDDRHCQSTAESKNIASHLIYYIQFIEGQRRELPDDEIIPVTRKYTRCFELTQKKCRRRKSDPLSIPEEYAFLGEFVD